MTESFDFEPESVSASENKIDPALGIFGCLGCGGLGLLIMGIVAAIAVPNLFWIANNSKAFEGRNYIDAITKAQQSYYLQNGSFIADIELLGLGFLERTNYQYEIDVLPDQKGVAIFAFSQEPELRSYSGAVFITDNDRFFSGICESHVPQSYPPQMPKLIEDNLLQCPEGSSALKNNEPS